MSIAVAAPPSPFKGLAPFEDSDLDARLFFGRERESEVIAANLIASRVTVLYGPSGVGKSSVLRAGVAHRLRSEQDAEVVVFSTWTGDPVAGLIAAADGSGDSMVDALADAADRAGGDLYVILDQFEELFLYHRRGGAFAEQLAELLRRPGLRVNVLIGIREDALARLDALKASIPNLLANRLRLERLDRAAGVAAIVGPVTRYNELVGEDERVEIEPELEDAVLDEVAAGRVELSVAGRGVVLGGRDEDRIEAPYLQLVMSRLWNVEQARGSRTLRLSTLRELGGAEHIVEDHLERAMADLSPREKGAAAAMYNFLVTPSGTKIAHGVRDLAGYAAVDEGEASGVLQRLTAERIVRASSENGPTTTRYEIFHDVLADAVLAWRARFEAERAIEDERDRHRRRQRRFLAIGIAALLGMAVMAAIAIYALQQRSEAQHQAAVAQEQQAIAEENAKTAETALASEKKAKKKAQKSEQKAKKSEQKAKQSEQNAKQAAVVAETEKEKANASAEAERRARQHADELHALADARLRLAQRETRRKTAAQRLAVRQKNINRAERLAAEARVLVTQDAERSVRRLLTALGAFHVAKIRPPQRLEDTLREGLLRLRLRAVLRLPGRGTVHVVRFSPNDSLLFAGGEGGAALYDRGHGFKPRALLPQANIVDAAFSPNGALVAAAGAGKDRVAHVWDVRSGAQVLALEHQGPVNAVAFSPNGQLIATGSDDGTARLWSVATGVELASFKHEAGTVRSKAVLQVSFSADGTRLLTVGGNRFARVFDVSRGNEVFALNNVAVVNVARFSHDGSLIATGGATDVVRLWDARTGDLVGILPLTENSRVADLAFSPNDKLLATAGSNDTVARIFNVLRQRNQATITQHRSGVASVVFTPDSESLITAGRDGRAVMSAVAAGFEQASLAGHTRPLEGADVSHDGALIATWSQDGTARIWNGGVGAYTGDIGKHELPSTARRGPEVAFSPSGRYMLSAGADGTAHLWGAGTSLHVLSHDGAVNSASFSRNGRVITGSDDGTARVWHVADGRPLATLQNGAAVTAARLTPNGRFAVTGDRDGVVRVWNVARKSDVRRYELGGVVNDLELSRDGRSAVAASSNGKGAVYGVTARSEVLLRGHTDEVVAAAFAPDGKRVATASADWTARIWNARTGVSIVLGGHTGALTSLAFNNTGSLLATTGADTDIRVWNGRTGAEVTVLSGHSGGVNDLTFSADGRWIASAGPLAAGIWQVPAGRAWQDTPLYYVYGNAQRSPPRLDHVAFSPKGWRLLTGWRGGQVRFFNCTMCGGIKELRAIAKKQLNEVVRPKRPT
jgi:WD40 repeat protein